MMTQIEGEDHSPYVLRHLAVLADVEYRDGISRLMINRGIPGSLKLVKPVASREERGECGESLLSRVSGTMG